MDEMSHLPPSYVLAGDTAFGTSVRMVRPLSVVEYSKNLTEEERRKAQESCSLLSKLRIASEWGVGSISNTFRILNTPLPIDDLQFGSEVWELCARLHNVRVRCMKVGQVYKVFSFQN